MSNIKLIDDDLPVIAQDDEEMPVIESNIHLN
jgi:hypothetical protein